MLRKTVAISVLAAAVALCLFGCAGQGTEPGGSENEGAGVMNEESQVDAVREYVADPAVVEVMQNMNDRFSEVVDCMESGEYEEADSICVEAVRACDEVLNMGDVPEQAKAVHEKVCDVASAFSDTFFCYEVAAGSMLTGDPKEAVSKIEEANGYYSKVAEKINDVSALIDTYM